MRRGAAIRLVAMVRGRLSVALLTMPLLLGCWHQAAAPAVAPPAIEPAWLTFDVVERGSHLPLYVYIWVDGHREDFEVIAPATDNRQRFDGIGRTADGYLVPIRTGDTLTLLIWAERHELERIELLVRPGENPVPIQLRKTEVIDNRIPKEIWLDLLQRMLDVAPPRETLKSGT